MQVVRRVACCSLAGDRVSHLALRRCIPMPLIGLDRDAGAQGLLGVLHLEQVIAWLVGGFGWEIIVSCTSRERKTESMHRTVDRSCDSALWAVTGEAKN